MKKKKAMSVFSLTEAAVITALIFILEFSGLGYIKIGAVELSVMAIPVCVGAVAMGPAWGAFFGGMFGLTSFIECFRGSFLGALLFGINPFYTVIVCFVPRILMGLLSGLIFKAVRGKPLAYNPEEAPDEATMLKRKKTADRRRDAACFVAGLSAPVLNTVFFMATLLMLFYNNAEFMGNEAIAALAENNGVIGFTVAFVTVNALFEFAAGAVLGTALNKAALIATSKIKPNSV